MKTTNQVITGFPDSTSLLDSPDALRARAEEDGFLFFKGLLPKEPLLALRRQILEIVDGYGWLDKGADLMDGVGNLETIARDDALDPKWKYIGVAERAYRDVQSLELFHTIPHHPKLIALYRTLFQDEVFPHPRHIARVLLPAPSLTPTPPHQDYLYIQGTHNFWTCWFPLGDCPMELGGLSVLRGSHREKVLPVSRASGAGGFESHLCDMDYAWIQDHYECGDIITFPSHMVHKALPNQRPGRARLSCDLRYQPLHEPIEERSFTPHCNIATWDELYKGWKNDAIKYYWKTNTFQMAPWNQGLLAHAEKIC